MQLLHPPRKNLSPCERTVFPRYLLVAGTWIGILLGAGCQNAQPLAFDPNSAEAAIRQVLDTQVAAWNRGDIPAFMEGYVKSDSLRFTSDGQVQYGWQNTLDRYYRAYPDHEAMGTLSFENLDINVLSANAAMVFGGYRLKRSNDEPTGLFTLIFEKQGNQWLIIHDHTSANRNE